MILERMEADNNAVSNVDFVVVVVRYKKKMSAISRDYFFLAARVCVWC